MLLVFITGSFIFLISLLVMSIASIFSKKSYTDREKSSPFECGFDPKSYSRAPFSLRFFLISIIFLIFDVEIVLILPVILLINISNMFCWCYTLVIFLFILLVGLYHEWSQGMLAWTF